MLHKADHIWEGQDSRSGQAVGVQSEARISILDAYIGGATGSFDRQREQVAGVGTISY